MPEANQQAARSTKRLIIFTMVFLLLVPFALWLAFEITLGDWDRCMDAGGAWDEDAQTCSNPRVND